MPYYSLNSCLAGILLLPGFGCDGGFPGFFTLNHSGTADGGHFLVAAGSFDSLFVVFQYQFGTLSHGQGGFLSFFIWRKTVFFPFLGIFDYLDDIKSN